ncbi:AAA family ATPase [Tsukamurella tyrosinosolvens]|uniref:AAA family ATPase n=1 Tax=Tsukamurella tyrosinosolvens TaxID=57704 RepID=UPI002DD43239|nr:AAA family ATPase [Tsukamurella tyrosinosolvens]MEC4611817.1 AAA family ATPase [Tsukamurella tyrosinosolvens]
MTISRGDDLSDVEELFADAPGDILTDLFGPADGAGFLAITTGDRPGKANLYPNTSDARELLLRAARFAKGKGRNVFLSPVVWDWLGDPDDCDKPKPLAHDTDGLEPLRFPVLWVDADSSDAGMFGKPHTVHSGGRTDSGGPRRHLRLRLDVPLTDAREVEHLNGWLCAHVRGDNGKCHIYTWLTLPGSTRFKPEYPEPREVAVIDRGDTITVESVREALRASETPEPSAREHVVGSAPIDAEPPSKVPAIVRSKYRVGKNDDEQRHVLVASLLMSARNAGMSNAELLWLLTVGPDGLGYVPAVSKAHDEGQDLERYARREISRLPRKDREAEDGVDDNGLSEVTQEGKENASARLWRAKDLDEAQAPKWLAAKRVPAQMLSIEVGDEGIGKSQFWVWLVAAITTGTIGLGCTPEDNFGIPEREPQDVVIVVTEDDWATAVLPRLIVAGADLDRVLVLCVGSDGTGAPTFPKDIDLLPDTCALVIIDTLGDTVDPSLNIQKPQDARRALNPWKDYATRSGAAVISLSHTNRQQGSGTSLRDRYGMTGELRKVARMALFVQELPKAKNGNKRFAIGPEKTNGSGEVEASVFEIEAVGHFPPTDDSDGTVARARFVETSRFTSQQLAQQAVATNTSTPEAMWLSEYLLTHNGEAKANDIYDAGTDKGFSRTVLREARKKLGISQATVGLRGPSWWFMHDVEGREHTAGKECNAQR